MTMNRRSFVKNALQSSVGIAVSSSLPIGLLASSPASAQEDYKAIVCVLLAGGADSFNILVPRSTQAYNQYQSRRSDLALSQSDLLPLDGAHGGRELWSPPGNERTAIALQCRAGNLGDQYWSAR